jgi:hypothetical protein
MEPRLSNRTSNDQQNQTLLGFLPQKSSKKDHPKNAFSSARATLYPPWKSPKNNNNNNNNKRKIIKTQKLLLFFFRRLCSILVFLFLWKTFIFVLFFHPQTYRKLLAYVKPWIWIWRRVEIGWFFHRFFFLEWEVVLVTCPWNWIFGVSTNCALFPIHEHQKPPHLCPNILAWVKIYISIYKTSYMILEAHPPYPPRIDSFVTVFFSFIISLLCVAHAHWYVGKSENSGEWEWAKESYGKNNQLRGG